MDANCWFSAFPSSSEDYLEFKDNMDKSNDFAQTTGILVWTPWLKAAWRGKGPRCLQVAVHGKGKLEQEGSWTRELKQVMGEHSSLACSPWIVQPFLDKWHPLSQRWYYPRWASPPTSIVSWENAPQICPQAILLETFSQLRFPHPGCP